MKLNNALFAAFAAVSLLFATNANTVLAAELSPEVAKVVGTPADGKAKIIFFREKKFAGAAIKCNVIKDGQNLAILKSGMYFVLEVEPGTHKFDAQKKVKDSITLDVEEGEVVFVEGGIAVGAFKGKANLSPSSEAAFAAALPKLKLVK